MSSREGTRTQDIGCVCFLTKGRIPTRARRAFRHKLARIRTRSTSTGLDSHVASNCRFGKQAATAFRKTGVGQCLAGEHRMTLPRMYRLSHPALRVDRAGPARAGSATPHRYKLSRLGLTERSQRRAPTTRSFLRGAALQAPPFGSCIANAPGGRHARCAKRASR